MKKHTLAYTNITICIIVIVGFIGISLLNSQSNEEFMDLEIENVSKLTSENIYTIIENIISTPIYVSKTMANDMFLKTWVQGEQQNQNDFTYSNQLINYLQEYKKKYDYDSVFFVSATSQKYYHHEGIDRVLTQDNEENVRMGRTSVIFQDIFPICNGI